MKKELLKKPKVNKRTIRFKKNQALIIHAYTVHFKKHNHFPTNIELAKITNMTEQSIINHHKHFDLPEIVKEFRSSYPLVLGYIIKCAETNPSSQKLAAQIMGALKEVPETNITFNIKLPDYLDK